MSRTKEYLETHITAQIEQARKNKLRAEHAIAHYALEIEAWTAVAAKMGIAIEVPKEPEKK